jgi:hypothetical protein
LQSRLGLVSKENSGATLRKLLPAGHGVEDLNERSLSFSDDERVRLWEKSPDKPWVCQTLHVIRDLCAAEAQDALRAKRTD